LGAIVSVVDYLQTSELDNSKLRICTQHKALDQNLVSNELQALRLAQLIDLADTDNPMAAGSRLCDGSSVGSTGMAAEATTPGLLHHIAQCL